MGKGRTAGKGKDKLEKIEEQVILLKQVIGEPLLHIDVDEKEGITLLHFSNYVVSMYGIPFTSKTEFVKFADEECSS